jgi:deoxyribodipyrimidine photo-lyase
MNSEQINNSINTPETEREEIVACWLRRDLRLNDNTALYQALKSGKKVVIVFIYDRAILDRLSSATDRRVQFINEQTKRINRILADYNSTLVVEHATPFDAWKNLTSRFNITAVYCNHDYEPYANERDGKIRHLLRSRGAQLHTYKDQCIFEKREILTATGNPYTVFTPYSRSWKSALTEEHIEKRDSFSLLNNLYPLQWKEVPSLNEIGFAPTDINFPPDEFDTSLISNYDKLRDFPAQRGTTRLSVHLRFGTISIRECVRIARQHNETWLNELIWRDFYMMILANYPHIVEHSFKPQYDAIEWRNNEEEIERWKEGTTGYPIVDAGMRELNQTGFMHNRVRMITASFLVKHLLADWRIGERYFAEKLLDYDLSANNGGWQWSAGSGCDAAPYFRIFNPTSQTEKFDENFEYIRRWVPEYGSPAYTKPIVEHSLARERCLATYKQALSKQE